MNKYWLTAVCLFGIMLQAGSQTTMQQLEEQKKSTLSEIDYANRLLEETRGKKEASLNELSIVSHLLQQRRKNISILENESHEISLSIEQNLASISSIQSRINEIRYNYAAMIVSAYKNKRKNYLLMYVLAAENTYQAYKRIRYYILYNDYIKRQAEEFETLTMQLQAENNELMQMYSEKEDVINAATSETNKIKSELSQKNRILTDLEKREKELIKEIKTKEETAKKIDREITSLIEAEKKAAKAENILETLTPAEKLVSDEFGKNRGKLPWPTEKGIVTGKYGEHQHPDYKSVTVRNDGIYISTLPGTEVRAVFKGKVSKVFSIPGENLGVLIKHGEYYTLYYNLVNVKVVQGQEIETRQLIGNVYTDESTRESLLYFQIWKDIEINNPEDWLSN